MLDLIGSMALTALALLISGSLVYFIPGSAALRWRLAVVLAAWFVLIAGLAADGVFGVFSAGDASGVRAIGAAVLVPIVLGAIVIAFSRELNSAVLGFPLGVLVALHAGRLLGGFFLALLADGRLPPTFALSAGWGDVAAPSPRFRSPG